MEMWNKITEANASIKTSEIKGKAYAEVNQRVKAFRFVYPKGSIKTEMTYLSGEEGQRIVGIKATVFDEEGRYLSDGYAEEKESSSYINKTSFIENCQTSAVGRALGFAGFGIDVSIASKEEVENAINNQNQDPVVYATEAQKKIIAENANLIIDELKELNMQNMSALSTLTVSKASVLCSLIKERKNGTD